MGKEARQPRITRIGERSPRRPGKDCPEHPKGRPAETIFLMGKEVGNHGLHPPRRVNWDYTDVRRMSKTKKFNHGWTLMLGRMERPGGAT